MQWWIRWLAAAWICVASEGKYQAGPLRLSGPKKENHWRYVSKFGYGIGKGTYEFRVKLHQPKTLPDPSTLDFEVYLDEDWEEVEAMEVCNKSSKMRQKRPVEVNTTGGWSNWVNGSLSQSIRPHIWYFALSDCGKSLGNYTHRLKFEFRALQEDKSEFSIEMKYMLPANILFLAGFTFYLWIMSQRILAFFRSAGSVHPVIWSMVGGIVIQYVAQVFHTVHLFSYRYNGQGFKPLEVLSEILFMLSQVTQTSLLILIALGYTLLQSKIGELDLMIPLCFMVAVIHIMLVGFGKIKDDASYKFHENEGVVGWILLIMRLVLWAWFLWAVQSSAAEGGFKLRNFLAQYRVAGSVYFLTYPAIFVITKLFAPYYQHGVMSIGLMTMQMSANVWLGSLFLTRGEYFKVSTLSDSELPGGAKVGLVKEE